MAKALSYTITFDCSGDGTPGRIFSRTEQTASSPDGGVHSQALASGNTVLTAPTGTTKGLWVFPPTTSAIAKYANTINSTTGIGQTANWTSQMQFFAVLAGANISINANSAETVDIIWV